jgi:hypothetical protein
MTQLVQEATGLEVRPDRELKSGVELIDAAQPFHSALPIAIWNNSHLSSGKAPQPPGFRTPADGRCGAPPDSNTPPIANRHRVEKRRLLPDAQLLLERAGSQPSSEAGVSGPNGGTHASCWTGSAGWLSATPPVELRRRRARALQ